MASVRITKALKRRLLPFVLRRAARRRATVAALFAFGGSGQAAIPVAAGLGRRHLPSRRRQLRAGRRRRCSDCGGPYSCLEQAFGNIAFAAGPAARARRVRARSSTRNRDVERDCHRIVHTIGSAAYARYDGNIARTFAEGSSICASGYYHGILERAFVGITSKAKLSAVAQ